jgi:tRNA threonylcarbamoyladenosine biosynthesis protein TsaB
VNEPVLALEGALGSFSAAVDDGARTVADAIDGRVALERGLGLVDELLTAANLRLPDVATIAVGTGPGGFTGLRIAIAFAKSLAVGAGRPIVGISSFDIVDAASGAETQIPRLTVVMGRTGIACIRRAQPDGHRVACGPIGATLARLWDGDEITLAGGTEDVRSAALERGKHVHFAPAARELPAATLARLARTRAPERNVHAVAPDYGEIPAVKMKQ